MSKISGDVNKRLKIITDEYGINFKKPIVIDSYNINKKSNTNTMLMKVSFDGKINTVVANLSIFVIKKKIIFYANYNNYNGVESVEKTNKQTNYFIKKIFRIN